MGQHAYTAYKRMGRHTDTYVLTYLLITPWKRVFLEKLTGSQLLKKYPAFYGSQRFITAFTCARHLSLTWATSIQFMPSHPTFWRSIWILSSHLRQGIDTYFHLNACMCTQSYITEYLLIHNNANFFSQLGCLDCVTDFECKLGVSTCESHPQVICSKTQQNPKHRRHVCDAYSKACGRCYTAVDSIIILKCVFMWWDGEDGLIWLMTRIVGGLLWMR